MFRGLGDRLGEASTLNSLGELLCQTSDTQQARDRHAQALAIARDLGAPEEEARALQGIGRCHLQDGDRGEGTAKLRQALAIYQRMGTPEARRVQQTLQDHELASTTPERQPAPPQTAKAISPHEPRR